MADSERAEAAEDGCTTLLNQRLGPTATRGFRLFEQGLKLLHDLRLLGIEVGGLSRIVFEVVLLSGGLRRRFGQSEVLEISLVVAVSAGTAMVEILPGTTPNRKRTGTTESLGD